MQAELRSAILALGHWQSNARGEYRQAWNKHKDLIDNAYEVLGWHNATEHELAQALYNMLAIAKQVHDQKPRSPHHYSNLIKIEQANQALAQWRMKCQEGRLSFKAWRSFSARLTRISHAVISLKSRTQSPASH